MLLGLLNDCPIGVSIISEDMERRLYANPKLAAIFGAETPESMLVSDVSSTWCDQDRFQQMKTFIQEGNELQNFVAKRKRVDGSVIWVSMNTQLAEVDGRTARIVWTTEVTDLVDAFKESNITAQAASA